MSANGNGGGRRLLINVVEEARQKQAEEDRLGLEHLGAGRRLQELQALEDLSVLRPLGLPGGGVFEFLVTGTAVRPSDQEILEATRRLARLWVGQWRDFDARVGEAVWEVAERQDISPEKVREQALEAGIFLALSDAGEAKVVRVGRDHAMSFGSDVRLLQKQEWKRRVSGDWTDGDLDRMMRPPAGVHEFHPFHLVGAIEAAFLGHDLYDVHPTDLRPSQFARWVRRQSINHAEQSLLEANFLSSGTMLGEDKILLPGHDKMPALAGEAGASSPMDPLIAAESADDILDALLATPGDRKILELLRDRLYRDLNITEAKRSVAELKSVGVGRIDVALHHVRKKNKDPR